MISFWVFYCLTAIVAPVWSSAIGNCSTQCPPNEVYKKCNGATCADVTCDRPNGPICEVSSCTPGCGCMDGYIRETIGGPCVLPSDCPNKCPENEIFNPDCYNLCIQDPTCVNPNPNNTRPLPIFCDVLSCGRCVCAPGYIRFGSKTSRCIKRKQCPRVCRDPNATYQECGSSCGNDCASVRNPNMACAAVCSEGCYCTPSYVLNERTQYCVQPRNCPK